MADLAAIRAGIRDLLFSAFPASNVTGYLLVNSWTPAFEVEIGNAGVVYDTAMQSGLDEWMFTIRGLAGQNLDLPAQMQLDAWFTTPGTSASPSVKWALEQDRTLGSTVSDSDVLTVSQVRSYTPIATPGSSFFGAEWTLRVIAPGHG